TTLTSGNNAGKIIGRAVLVPTGVAGVTISNLAQLTNAAGIAAELDGTATLTNNTSQGSAIGVKITGSATLSSNTFSNDGIGIEAVAGSQLTVGLNNVLRVDGSVPGAVGLMVSGAGSRITNLSLANTSFSGYGSFANDVYAELLQRAHQGP